MSVEELLRAPLDWRSWSTNRIMKEILDDLQPNILKGHGRDDTAHLFLTFDAAQRQEVAAALGWIGQAMAPALHQLLDADAFKAHKASGRQITCLFLTAAGYRKLGLEPPADPAFRQGMRARAQAIGDLPDGSGWDRELAGAIDGMLLVADSKADLVDQAVARWTGFLAKAGITAQVVRGHQQKRLVARQTEGVEHFGYVDGRSQPLFLADQVKQERDLGNTAWDPAFPPAQFLVRDPHGTDETSLGAYFVFRKLEQNVQGFKTMEQTLADALSLTGEDRERAGAMVVGRFEDGTPLMIGKQPLNQHPTNNFTYRADQEGERCPLRAHIRKTNPRGSAHGDAERGHIMARRGITYGDRQPGDLDSDDLSTKPPGGVGLLFMAYMANIADQFEFTQQAWANEPDHPPHAAGTDPVIGLGPRTQPEPWRDIDGTSVADFDFRGFVTMRGGEYFFAPSLSGLRRLAELAGAGP